MTIKNSPLANEANYTYNLNIGDFYFYDNFLVTEIYEGVIIGKEEFTEVIDLVHKHFGSNKPYGLISHRPYSYSINLSDLLQIASQFGLLAVNAVVAYSDLSLKNFELEKRLLKFKGASFHNVQDAFEWTKMEIEYILKNYGA